MNPEEIYLSYLLSPVAANIKKLTDEILDRLEYEGSVIFHEYPDKNALLRLIEPIYESPKYPSDETLRDLTEAIFYYEMYKRRARYFELLRQL